LFGDFSVAPYQNGNSYVHRGDATCCVSTNALSDSSR
jgi:hypothetical protein